MTHEQLEAISKRVERATEDGNGSSADAYMKRDARKDITALLAEVERLRNGILTAASSTHDDDTHEYLFRLLNGKERTNLPYRIGYEKDGGDA